MNIKIFNCCIIGGWLMFLLGGLLLNPGWGLIAAGLLMIILTLLGAKIAGVFADPIPAATDKGVA